MLIVQAAVFALTLPILFPVVVNLGFDPIWFCVVAMKLNEIAGVTTPVGLNAFALSGATGDNTPVEEIYKGINPALSKFRTFQWIPFQSKKHNRINLSHLTNPPNFNNNHLTM